MTSQSLTVLQVLPALNVGGVERGTIEIAHALKNRNHRALVSCEGGRLRKQLEDIGGTLIPLSLRTKNPYRIWRHSFQLADIIRAYKVDLVHARSRAPAWSAYWACQQTQTPFVTTYHGTYGESIPLKRLYNSVMAKGDRVIAVSHFVADLIRQRYGIDDHRLSVIPRGADLKLFSPQQINSDQLKALRKSWSLTDETRPIILLPGRLTPWKGQEHFIEALTHLYAQGKHPPFSAVIVGGETKQGFQKHLQDMITQRKMNDTIRLVGHCDDMPAAYALATAVVSASIRPEAFGRVAVEAQVMKTCVIGSDHGGACETIIPNQTGWLYEPGNALALAQTIGNVLALNPQTRQKITAAARTHVGKHFSITSMQNKTLDLYAELMDSQHS